MFLDLDIGNVICQLEVENCHWYRFLLKKYAEFRLIDPQRPPDLVIRLLPQRNRPQFDLQVAGKNLFCLRTPLTLRRFRSFNFFFKTAVASFFLKYDGLLLHSSSLNKEGKCLIFAGKRGSGKSTIVKLLPEYQALNDDFTIVRKINGKYRAFSSPFYETNPVPRGLREMSIKVLYFIKKSELNSVKKLSPPKAALKVLSLILNVLSMPETAQSFTQNERRVMMRQSLDLANDLCCYIPAYVLRFKKDRSFRGLLL